MIIPAANNGSFQISRAERMRRLDGPQLLGLLRFSDSGFARPFIDGNVDPEWNQPAIVTNAVRGLRLFFELFDEEDTHRDQLLGSEVTLPLFCLKKYDKRRPTEPTILKCSVGYTPKFVTVQPPLTILRNPVYITLSTNNPIRMRTPYDRLLDAGVRGIFPYVFPFELSVVVLNEATSTFDVISSANRVGKGAWHSGKNVCGGCESISPCIRLDPSLLISAGVRTLFVVVSSWDFSDLRTQLNSSGAVVVWRSREKCGEYRKSDRQALGTSDLQDLRLGGRFPFSASGPETLLACVRGTLSGKDEIDLVEIKPPYALPTPEHQVAPQTPSEVVPIVVDELHLSASRFAARQQLPLFVPRALGQVVGGGAKMEIQTRAGAYRAHMLLMVAADAAMRTKWVCAEERVPVGNGASAKQGTVKVQLAAVEQDIEFLMFVCYGEQVLGDEMHVEQQQLLVLANGSTEIVRGPYKYSKTLVVRDRKGWFRWVGNREFEARSRSQDRGGGNRDFREGRTDGSQILSEWLCKLLKSQALLAG
jgi:hypothetical protein